MSEVCFFLLLFVVIAVFYKPLILILLAIPIRVISLLRRRNSGHIRGERFFVSLMISFCIG